jgi:hypothetical protein
VVPQAFIERQSAGLYPPLPVADTALQKWEEEGRNAILAEMGFPLQMYVPANIIGHVVNKRPNLLTP